MIRLIVIMALAMQQAEGDPAFFRVDTRRPAHELEPGVAADARNKRFEDGRAWPRYGVAAQGWGKTLGAALVPDGATHDAITGTYIVNVTAGKRYFITLGVDEIGPFLNGAVATDQPAGGSAFITALGNSLTFYGHVGSAVTTQVNQLQTPRGFRRFNDPDGFDALVLVTDDWRSGLGEDGGRGRAYRIVAGQGPQPVPLNGFDIYGECRLVPAYNGLLLLRQDVERHYFSAASVNIAGSYFALNCAPGWVSGDLVLFNIAAPDSYVTGASPPNPDTVYYAKSLGSNHWQLCTDAALTTALSFTGGTAVGRFYLERRSAQPGYFGNGARPLLLQPDGSGLTCWQNGFLALSANVAATAYGTYQAVANSLVTAPNHRLVPGDAVTYTHSSGATQTGYAYPVSANAFAFYDTQLHALANQALGLTALTPAWNAADYVTKTGGAVAVAPPAREGCYTPNNRAVLVNQQNNLVISDPLDPLHYQPLASQVTANLGEGDPVVGAAPFGKDSVLVAKAGELHALVNFSGGPTVWALQNITREYGFGAALSIVPVGKDLWGFGRKGVVSVQETEFGELVGVALPTSYDMKKYLDLVDWRYAGAACAEVWNNRYFVAMPLKDQGTSGINNGVLVHNFLNANLTAGQHAWEGLWTGAALQPYAFARHNVFGEERLCFVNYDGQVCWLTDAWTDSGALGQASAIADSLTTRVYSGGSKRNKLWLKTRVSWDTQAASLTVTAQSPGVNESQVLAASLTYDKTQSKMYGKGTYNPAAPAGPPAFSDPDREDYAPSISELNAPGVALDLHQNTVEPFRMRLNDWGVQLVIANAAGSARIGAVEVEGLPGRNEAKI